MSHPSGLVVSIIAWHLESPRFVHENNLKMGTEPTPNVSHKCVKNILNLLFHQMTDEERSYGYFQEYSSHPADNSTDAICKVFDNRILSKEMWPPRSPSLTYC